MALINSRLPLRPSPPLFPLLPPPWSSSPLRLALLTANSSASTRFAPLRAFSARQVKAATAGASIGSSPLSAEASDAEGDGAPKVLLEVKDLRAVIAESKKEILHGVNLTIREGEVHAIMGKNGSGKSTFSKVLVGHPDYEVTGGTATFKGENLLDMDPEGRSHAGLFMSFQTPVEIPGVSNIDFLQMAYNARRKNLGLPELSPLEFFGFLSPKLVAVNMNPSFLNRNVNEGFSGGEKKRNEILQLAVEKQIPEIQLPINYRSSSTRLLFQFIDQRDEMHSHEFGFVFMLMHGTCEASHKAKFVNTLRRELLSLDPSFSRFFVLDDTGFCIITPRAWLANRSKFAPIDIFFIGLGQSHLIMLAPILMI